MRHLGVLLFSIALLSGCATVGEQRSFHIAVDSQASPTAKEKLNYVLLPGNENVTLDDLQFQEYSLYLKHALKKQGFIPADNAEDANIAIVVSYGIGDPRTEQHSYALPVWGQTGVSSANTYGTAMTFGNMASYSGTTTYTPTYGVTGYTTQIESATTYSRHILVAAYDAKAFKNSNKEIQIWRTAMTSRG
ncbi:hypothetical protein SAMN05216386_1682 [Nitrosospira briensis]|uniref:DUF4136 domain-containing protein n=1 Tax=Nitrosospira briensis TaxID=35799 RepID=A0A1I5BHY5_9PROT|nr:hypothetical protein [Nitrosospira briensis]SFN74354.1 hypothetical protein SAMN05216386_1682 [Nitrosospira briensis]